jgi:hypothetical protein
MVYTELEPSDIKPLNLFLNRRAATRHQLYRALVL